MRKWTAIVVLGIASLAMAPAYAQGEFSQTAYDEALIVVGRDEVTPEAYRLMWCFSFQGMLESAVTIYSKEPRLNAAQVYQQPVIDELSKSGMSAERQLEFVKAVALVAYGQLSGQANASPAFSEDQCTETYTQAYERSPQFKR